MNKNKTSTISVLLILMLAFSAFTGCSAGSFSDTAVPPDAETVTEISDTSSDDADPLRVYFLDVGQGDCTVLTQGDSAMLIDAGENDKGTAVQSYLEYLGIDNLDYAVLTHPDSDHIGGADVVLYKFGCDTILMPDAETDTKTYDEVIQAMNAKGESAVHPSPGDIYEFGEASFTILAPVQSYDDNNNNSIVLRLDYGENSFLFTGDAEKEVEEELLNDGVILQSDVIKMPHHGSKTSSTEDFVSAVSPQYAIVSCGDGGKNHPNEDIVLRWQTIGTTVLRTDYAGTVIVTTDGESLTLQTEKTGAVS